MSSTTQRKETTEEQFHFKGLRGKSEKKSCKEGRGVLRKGGDDGGRDFASLGEFYNELFCIRLNQCELHIFVKAQCVKHLTLFSLSDCVN